jgi:DNA-binding MarR family transcriptional regulator
MGPPEPDVELETRAVGYVPLLAAYFQRARAEMPEQLRETFNSYGLTARHGALLTQLLAEDSLSVTALAGRLGISLSTASGLVSDLADAGMVLRRTDPDSRRRTLVSLSDAHRGAFDAFVAVRAAPLLAALRELPADQRPGFVAGLAAWSRAAQQPSPGAPGS